MTKQSPRTETSLQMGTFSRMSWSEICSHGRYQGQWVALDGVKYDEATARPAEGTVVDADNDLAELCNRVRAANRRCCAILFCEEPRTLPTARARTRSTVAH